MKNRNPNHEDRKNKPEAGTAKAAEIESRRQRQETATGYDVSLSWSLGFIGRRRTCLKKNQQSDDNEEEQTTKNRGTTDLRCIVSVDGFADGFADGFVDGFFDVCVCLRQWEELGSMTHTKLLRSPVLCCEFSIALLFGEYLKETYKKHSGSQRWNTRALCTRWMKHLPIWDLESFRLLCLFMQDWVEANGWLSFHLSGHLEQFLRLHLHGHVKIELEVVTGILFFTIICSASLL
ncbi:hypothetical protein CMV_009159 [Castanea mollissima]|uniref:Uncharacterized protein n=1 Tax=Castanea mollissima TaxID=60419 RepID=A0A8J4REJ1_9ROSI|nr:hypothetical protein CMV_009159 [Castanea mollissima]